MYKFMIAMIGILVSVFCASHSALAAEQYQSQTHGFKIELPAKAIVVVNPFPDPAKRGELLIFEHEDFHISYAYLITLDAFNSDSIPDFNSSNKKLIDSYLEQLKLMNAYESAEIQSISKSNKAVFALTARELQITDEKGELQGFATASTQNEVALFRSPKSRRCISIQLITDELTDSQRSDFKKAVSTYQDSTELAG